MKAGRLAQSRVHAFQQLNVQLARLRMFIEMRELGANEEDKVRDKAFYKALLKEFRQTNYFMSPSRGKRLYGPSKASLSTTRAH